MSKEGEIILGAVEKFGDYLRAQGVPEVNQMTKGEIRKLRKAARAEGKPLAGNLALPGDNNIRGDGEFSEGPQGRRALDRWARQYDDLNGRPESDEDC